MGTDQFARRRRKLKVPQLSLPALHCVAFLFCALNIFGWFPGKSNPDSDSQYHQILTGVLDDWHPPAMTRLWEALLLFGQGTGPIFVLHIAAYWTAAILIAAALEQRGDRWWAWLALSIWAIPTFVMQNINITKDMNLTVALLLSFALVFQFRARTLPVPKWALAVATLLLVYGALVRANAVFAIGPLLAYYTRPTWLEKPLRLAIASVVLGVMLVPLSGLVNRDVLMAHDAGTIGSLQLFDISGIAHLTDDAAVFGDRSILTVSEVDTCYSPIMWDTLGTVACPTLIGEIGRTKKTRFDSLPPLSDLWIAAILKHPLAYAAHRLEHFNSTTYFAVPFRHTEAVRVIDTAGSRAPSLANKILDLVRYFPLLMPAVLLSIGLGLLAVLVCDKTLRESSGGLGLSALVLSALSYGFSFLLVGVATDLRYFLFPDMTILLALLLALLVVWQTRREPHPLIPYIGAIGFVALIASFTVGARLALSAPTPVSKTKSVQHLVNGRTNVLGYRALPLSTQQS